MAIKSTRGRKPIPDHEKKKERRLYLTDAEWNCAIPVIAAIRSGRKTGDPLEWQLDKWDANNASGFMPPVPRRSEFESSDAVRDTCSKIFKPVVSSFDPDEGGE